MMEIGQGDDRRILLQEHAIRAKRGKLKKACDAGLLVAKRRIELLTFGL